MNDPHVESLRYRVKTNEGISYKSPPTVTHEEHAFKARLEDNLLTVQMKEHHASADSAKRSVVRFLRSWEIQAALSFGRGSLMFEFEDARVIDRNPPLPGSPQVIQLPVLSIGVGLRSVKVQVSEEKYPDPPAGFVASPLVETMWHRFEMFLDGREPLASMAYFCLTVVEGDAGGRNAAAKRYAIHRDVLRKLGYLTSAVGDERSGRKFKPSARARAHSAKETEWMRRAVQAIIGQVGAHDADPTASLTQITMSDLPPL